MKKRIFIAYKTSQAVQDELKKNQAELKRLNPSVHIKWTDPKISHLTIQFIGEIGEEEIEKVKGILKNIRKNYQPFTFWLENIDAFPNISQPRIINVKVGEERKISFTIQKELAAGLIRENILIDNKPWRPHITLGRNKTGERLIGLSDLQIDKINWKVDSIELIESKLSADGPKYTILKSYKLG